MTGTFKIHGPQGEVREITGDPALLTLSDAIEQFGKVSGKQGGDWEGARVRVAGQEYSGSELSRTFRDIGLVDGGEISVLT